MLLMTHLHIYHRRLMTSCRCRLQYLIANETVWLTKIMQADLQALVHAPTTILSV